MTSVSHVTGLTEAGFANFGFVTMPDRAEAETARQNLHGAAIGRRRLIVTSVRASTPAEDALSVGGAIIFEPARRLESVDNAGSSSAIVFGRASAESDSREGFVDALRSRVSAQFPQLQVPALAIACFFCGRTALKTEKLAVGLRANIGGDCTARCASTLN